MRDSQQGGPSERNVDELSALARSVVARLVARGSRPVRGVDAGLLHAMARAVTNVDPAAYEALMPELRRARINDADLSDAYFPAVARLLGCDWVEDRAGFATVSIGMARLQSLLHQIDRNRAAPALWDGATVLAILPEGEQHSFGVQLLAHQLRRQGVAVHLQIGARPADLSRLVRARHYDCAVVSLACKETLEIGRKVVKSLKDGSKGRLFVAVGGSLLDRIDGLDVLTGADLASSDPMQALGAAGRRDDPWALELLPASMEAAGKRLEST
jgi:MerR family transcriptional regulator, light-induced transcriptional regulator